MKIVLNKGDRVCFLGDSITAHGIWEMEVIEYFLNNYKSLEIEFYNCGISGSQGRLAEIKNRLYCDFLNYYPKYAVILFGTNDVAYYLYNPDEENEEIIKRREERALSYEKTLKRIVEVCKSRSITPIICSPTPYDEYNDPPQKLWNVDKRLEKFANIAKQIANENELLFIDMRKILMEHIYEKPIRDDRVHPNEYGYHLMAEKFLYDIGAKDNIEVNKTCIISEKNKRRFEIEDILRDIMFVERDFMGWQYQENIYSIEYRKALLKKKIPEDNRKSSQVYINYMKYAGQVDELRGELLKRTIDMYR